LIFINCVGILGLYGLFLFTKILNYTKYCCLLSSQLWQYSNWNNASLCASAYCDVNSMKLLMFVQTTMDDSDLSTETYSEGSLVWAKMTGYPW